MEVAQEDVLRQDWLGSARVGLDLDQAAASEKHRKIWQRQEEFKRGRKVDNTGGDGDEGDQQDAQAKNRREHDHNNKR